MQEIQLWMYVFNDINTTFSYGWVFQIDAYECLTCMHVSISYLCVYKELYMYACVFKCFHHINRITSGKTGQTKKTKTNTKRGFRVNAVNGNQRCLCVCACVCVCVWVCVCVCVCVCAQVGVGLNVLTLQHNKVSSQYISHLAWTWPTCYFLSPSVQRFARWLSIYKTCAMHLETANHLDTQTACFHNQSTSVILSQINGLQGLVSVPFDKTLPR